MRAGRYTWMNDWIAWRYSEYERRFDRRYKTVQVPPKDVFRLLVGSDEFHTDKRCWRHDLQRAWSGTGGLLIDAWFDWAQIPELM